MPRAERFRRSFVSALACAVLSLGLAVSAQAQCQLNSPSSKIKHVVYIEFDNVHFTRDNPNVPSDLEQMPNLLNFIKQHGTLVAGDHTVLISHTANDILTTEIGLYSDNDGIFIGNNFGVFEPGNAVIDLPSAFFYWTDLVSDITPSTKDNNFALVTPKGKNVPAPWVPFTRAGCEVGAFSTANIVLERTPFDVAKVFGAGSTQAMDPDAFGNYIGAAIHCSINSPFCTQANNAVPDLLPDEPGGYTGYQALFGLKYISPALGGLTDYNGNPINNFDNISFDPLPSQTLAVVETMLKKGIPVVFAYIADAHDNQENIGPESTFGPGEAAYVQQLADYNASFGTFFANLKAAGIDETNTVFIFTPDEGDHPVTGTASPAGCDGAKIVDGMVVPDVPCTYGPNGVGEVQIRLDLAAQAAGNNTPFTIHFDDAPTVYIPGAPGPSDPEVRGLEHTFAGLTAINPHTGQSESLLGTGLGPQLQGAIVDPVGQKLLHMNATVDPARTPTFTFFGNPNFYFNTVYPNGVFTGDAWNHGDIQPEIGRTFIAIAGPGVRHLGITEPEDFFTDHVDARPTLMLLTGLKDDYPSDGRAILELLDSSALPSSLHAHSDTLLQLGQIYKQINAPFGQLAKSTLKVSTDAITSNSNGDWVYTKLESAIASWTAERDFLAAQIKSMLDAAEFHGQAINENQANQLIRAGQNLLDRASSCAEEPEDCSDNN
jgi:hypothetical protein